MVAVLGFMQSCETINPKIIKDRIVDVKVEEEKVIIMVRTRYNPKIYRIRKVALVDKLLTGHTIRELSPFKEEYSYEGVMYHPSFGYEIPFFEYYIHEGMFVIKIDKSHIPDEYVGFNFVSVLFQYKFEYYYYETDKLINLSEKIK